MDSVPLVVITGQVPRGVIGTDSFQESDIVGITMPIVKHSFLLQSAEELTTTFREAFHIASTGRPGPVLIDVPSDIQSEQIVFNYPDAVNLPSYRPTYKGNAKQIKQAVGVIERASKPILYVGGGAIASGATEELVKLSTIMQIPVVTTLMGKGAFPASHPMNLGPVGMHGSKFANLAMTESDLIIAAGARFSDRVTGKLSEFAPHAKVIGIVATIEKEVCAPRTEAWNAQIAEWRERYPFYDAQITENPDEIVPEIAMQKLSAKLDPHNSVVVTEVGQHQMWAAQFIDREEPRSFISSGGLGTMGFGFPASIGAAFGRPGAQVVCIAGDGSFQMNSQEMATAAIHNVPVKVVIMDNRALGMVHQWQKLFYSERYSFTELDANPDFVKLADAYSWQAERVTDPAKLDEAYDRMLACDGPFLLDVAISDQQNVFPMVAPGKAMSDVMGAIDVAVGAVRTDVPGEPAPVVREKSPCAKIDAQFGGRWEADPKDKGPHQGEGSNGEGAAEEEGDVR